VNKKIILSGIVISFIVVGSIVAFSSNNPNVEGGRTHGTVSTEMGSPILGDPAAPITIVEFGDYQCHACYNWFHTHRPAVYDNYISTGKANLVFVDLAFLGRDSPTASQASYCAEDQGMYWQYHDLLYNSQEARFWEILQKSSIQYFRSKETWCQSHTYFHNNWP